MGVYSWWMYEIFSLAFVNSLTSSNNGSPLRVLGPPPQERDAGWGWPVAHSLQVSTENSGMNVFGMPFLTCYSVFAEGGYWEIRPSCGWDQFSSTKNVEFRQKATLLPAAVRASTVPIAVERTRKSARRIVSRTEDGLPVTVRLRLTVESSSPCYMYHRLASRRRRHHC
jgi:hypothetical protein